MFLFAGFLCNSSLCNILALNYGPLIWALTCLVLVWVVLKVWALMLRWYIVGIKSFKIRGTCPAGSVDDLRFVLLVRVSSYQLTVFVTTAHISLAQYSADVPDTCILHSSVLVMRVLLCSVPFCSS